MNLQNQEIPSGGRGRGRGMVTQKNCEQSTIAKSLDEIRTDFERQTLTISPDTKGSPTLGRGRGRGTVNKSQSQIPKVFPEECEAGSYFENSIAAVNPNVNEDLDWGKGRGRGRVNANKQAPITVAPPEEIRASKTDANDNREGDHINAEQGIDKFPIPPGFVHPNLTGIKSWVDDKGPGYTTMCVASYIENPSEIYLIDAAGFYGGMEKFVEKMTATYTQLTKKGQRYTWIACPQHITSGSIVCIREKNERGRYEWVRAKVISRNVQTKNQPYKCFLVDLGKFAEVQLGNIVFLLEEFATQPSWAVKCRLALSPYYDKYHAGGKRWPESVSDKCVETLDGHKFEAEFLAQVKQNGETIWEVTLHKFEKKRLGIKPYREIQHQIIKMCYGEYVDSFGRVDQSV